MNSGVPPNQAGAIPSRCDRPPHKMEIQEHRLAISGQQHVRRFDVHVNQTAIVCVLQAVGKAGPDRDDRIDVGAAQLKKCRNGPQLGSVIGSRDWTWSSNSMSCFPVRWAGG